MKKRLFSGKKAVFSEENERFFNVFVNLACMICENG
jgi:hypothetical protein